MDQLRTAEALIAQAADWSMANWLRPLPDGRTVKQAFAEVAARARSAQLSADRRPSEPSEPSEPPDLDQMIRERQRRTVGVLVRETHEALTDLAGRGDGVAPSEIVAISEGLDACVAAVAAGIDVPG